MKKKIKNLTVYYDGTCPMCTAFKSQSDKNTDQHEIRFLDVHTDPIPNFLSKEDILSEIRVVDSDGNVSKGSDSIFAVLRRHRWLFWLGYLGSLPIIKQCARPIYRLISAQRYFIFGPLSKIFWIRTVTIISLLAGLIISLPLWIGDRIIPLVPVFNLPAPEIISGTLFLLLIPILIWAWISPRPKTQLLLTPTILGLLVLFDQNRIQPWVYQYGAILFLLSTYSWRIESLLQQDRILNVLRLMIASIYFYSGLQKINPVFIGSVFPWMLEPYLGEERLIIGALVGLFIPFIEMFIGIGLLFKKTRSVSLVGAAAMLILVLLVLGPLGNNWNTVVWPWNIAFTVVTFILFWRLDKSALQILSIPKTTTSFLIIVLFIFCPLLFFFDKWDGYPSFSLYSGQVSDLKVTLPADFELSNRNKAYVVEGADGNQYFNVTKLAMSDIHVPVYPETRVHKIVVKKVCGLLEYDKRVIFEYVPRLHWFTKHELSKYSCASLAGESN